MNLRDLLEELRVGILHDVSDEVDGNSSYLWNDERLTLYINIGQRRYARYGFAIMDGVTPEVTQVALVEGVKDYTLHPSIFSVISARYDTDTADLARAGHAVFNVYRQGEPPFYDPGNMTIQTPGRPLAFSTNECLRPDDDDRLEAMSIQVYPTPSAAEDGKIITLRTFRYPLEPMRVSLDEPELSDDKSIEALDWAAYLALRVVDHNAGDVSRAHEFRKMFEMHVTNAKNTVMRKLFAPTQWGFGRGGFTWER